MPRKLQPKINSIRIYMGKCQTVSVILKSTKIGTIFCLQNSELLQYSYMKIPIFDSLFSEKIPDKLQMLEEYAEILVLTVFEKEMENQEVPSISKLQSLRSRCALQVPLEKLQKVKKKHVWIALHRKDFHFYIKNASAEGAKCLHHSFYNDIP